ncbi:unnamed protein product [Orchesella dallaii]|uniref:Uncharacterized protein n=1 Tax=Orchesella dallaii TaxID=48710 RepID=A0ABP1RQD3_9HEXA
MEDIRIESLWVTRKLGVSQAKENGVYTGDRKNIAGSNSTPDRIMSNSLSLSEYWAMMQFDEELEWGDTMTNGKWQDTRRYLSSHRET